MGFARGPFISSGLVWAIDYASPRSYPGSGTSVSDIVKNVADGDILNFGSRSGDIYTTDFNGGITRTSRSAATRTSTNNINNSSPITFDATAGDVAFSLECVWKPSGFASSTFYGLENVLIAKGGFSTLNYLMQFNSTQLTFCHRSPNENLLYTDFSTTFSTGNVYHTVLTVIDDSNGDGNVIGYNNGVNLGQTDLAGDPIQPDDDGDDPLYYPAGGGTDNVMNFDGTYFTARIYNKRLTDAEVLQNYNALKPRFGL
tara:strand:+ start:157 stop:927 length:771 start_codon:yes stop_codon:yes gene_type:complete